MATRPAGAGARRRETPNRPWPLHRIGLASAFVVLAVFACATSARADDAPAPADPDVALPDNGSPVEIGSTSTTQPVSITIGIDGTTAVPPEASGSASENDAVTAQSGDPTAQSPASGVAEPVAASSGTAVSVQTAASNGSVTVVIGVAGDTQGVTQSNTSAAAATAVSHDVTEPEQTPREDTGTAASPAATPAAEPVEGVGPEPSTGLGPGLDAEPEGDAVHTDGNGELGSQTGNATSNGNGNQDSRGRDNRNSRASASASQSKPKNKNVEVRVGAPGTSGAVTQENNASATAVAASTSTSPSASAGTTAVATASQEAPGNTNVAVRVASPGDNGAVTQTNTSSASATTEGSQSTAGVATALATQTTPTNTNVSLRVASPGTDGTVTQASTATQTTTTSGTVGPVSVAASGAGNAAIGIQVGNATIGSGASVSGATWDWDWLWNWLPGDDWQTAADALADQIASWQWTWGAPAAATIGPETPSDDATGDAGRPSEPTTAADSSTQSITQAESDTTSAAQSGWSWQWSWQWQRDDGTAWEWEWSWSRPCDCNWSWNWDWNWDWRTGIAAPPVGLPELTNEASLLPPAPLLAPVSQSNTSTSAATAAAESHVTRITVPVPEHDPSVGQDATAVQAAEATALSTQTFVGNTSARVVQADAPTSATNAAPAAASVGSTGAVAQSNDASATSTSTAASDAVQSVLQGELFGSTVGAIPTVAQHLDVTQFAVAQSSSIQTDAQNIAVVDLSPGMFVGVTQANEASGTASAEDTATTYQGSEQAQAESSTRQTISQAATIAQAGSAVAAVAQAGVANTAVVEAARPIAAARETTTLVAPALRPATLVTQVNTSQADASVASSSHIEQIAAQLALSSSGIQQSFEGTDVTQLASATATADQAGSENVVVPDLELETQPPIGAVETTNLDLTQLNVTSATAAAANASLLTQNALQLQIESEGSSASAAQDAGVTQAAEAAASTTQAGTINAADDTSLGTAGTYLQGLAAVAEASSGNGSAIAQSVLQEQRAIDGAEAEAVNQSDVDQANASSASAAITDILNLGPFVDGRSTTVASSGPARADNFSLVEQIVEQTQEILPEIPESPHGHGGGSNGGGSGTGSGGSGTGGGASGDGTPGASGGGPRGSGGFSLPPKGGTSGYTTKEVTASSSPSGSTTGNESVRQMDGGGQVEGPGDRY